MAWRMGEGAEPRSGEAVLRAALRYTPEGETREGLAKALTIPLDYDPGLRRARWARAFACSRGTRSRSRSGAPRGTATTTRRRSGRPSPVSAIVTPRARWPAASWRSRQGVRRFQPNGSQRGSRSRSVSPRRDRPRSGVIRTADPIVRHAEALCSGWRSAGGGSWTEGCRVGAPCRACSSWSLQRVRLAVVRDGPGRSR
jgi:hypothetical protein